MRLRRPKIIVLIVIIMFIIFIVLAANFQGTIKDIFLNLGTELGGALITVIFLDIILKQVRKSDGKQIEGFDYNKFNENIRKTKTQVRVLTTFTYLLSDDAKNRQSRREFRESLAYLVKNRHNITIQFLLLDPFSDAADQRAEERQDEKVIYQIKQNLSELYYLKKDTAFQRVHVKVYDALPRISLFQWDDNASMSFYPRNRSISETDRFEFSVNTPLGDFLTRTFNDLWTDEKTIDINQYMCVGLQAKTEIGWTELYNVHFVKLKNHNHFYLLVTSNEEWAWILAQAKDAPIDLKVIFRDEVFICQCREIDQNIEFQKFKEISAMASSKYGRSEFQKILELKQSV